jgi:O-antigen/teichoic acid export membrane protein
LASFLKNTGIVTLSQIGTTVTLMVVGIITARYLGSDGKGQLAIALGLGMILAQILCMGFDRSATYHLAKGRIETSRVLGSWIITLIIGTLVAYGIIYPLAASFLADKFLKGISRPLLFWSSLICPLYMARLLVNSILGGHKEFFRQTYHNISVFAAGIISAVTALIIMRWGTVGYTKLHIILGFCSLCFGVYVFLGVVRCRPVFAVRDWWEMFRYGIKAALSQIFNLIDLRLDIFIINYFVNNSAVGVYSVAGAIVGVFCRLADSVSIVLFPTSASLGGDNARVLTALVCRNAVWVTAVLGGLFLIVSRPVIGFVFGEEFADASLALMLLMPGVIGQVISRICFTDCSARGEPGKATIAAAVTATLTIGFDLLLIPRYGMYGAAVASSIAYCTGGLLGLFWHRRLSGNRLRELLVPCRDDIKYYSIVWGKITSKMNLKMKGS